MIVEPGLIETAFGEVVTEGMRARSGHGAYEALTRAVTQSTQAAYGHGKYTRASVIAKVVWKAVKTARPRTRYVAGAFARPMLFIRKWFGDSLFDRMIMSQVK